MKIKKYVGNSVQEAMAYMKSELGDEAVVLNTRTVKDKGLFSIFKKPRFEITAAYEKESFSRKTSEKEDDSMEDIKNELRELKELLEELPKGEKKTDEIHESLKKYHRILVANGVNMDISYNILKDITDEIDLDGKEDVLVENILIYKLKEIMGISEPIYVGDEQKAIFFVGPTGVGKTTTLAKLASSLVMENKYDIGLITSDTYRVGAVDQLKIYSDILDLNLEVAYDKQDMEASFSHLSEKDIVLVDTAGRNHNSREQTDQLREILDSKEDKEVYLLVSSTTDIRSLEELVKKYNFLGEYKLIITKLDESGSYGSLLNIKYIFDKEISYYTLGQNVPEDIRILDIDQLVDRLIEER